MMMPIKNITVAQQLFRHPVVGNDDEQRID